MLMLLFQLGEERYALPASRILEIVPLVQFKPIHRSLDYILGAFNYKGTVIPALDLSQLLRGVRSRCYLSTRVLVLGSVSEARPKPLIGLVAEQVKETLEINESAHINSAQSLGNPTYFGPIVLHQQEMIQCLKLAPFLGLHMENHTLDVSPQEE